MADYIDQYERHLHTLSSADATISTYLGILHRLDRDLPYGLASAHGAELRDVIYIRDRPAATRALYRAAVRAFFAWAADEDGPLDHDPSRYLPRVKVPAGVPRPAETEQLDDILTRARQPYLTWYLLAAGCGLRCVEISRLDRKHVTETRIWVQGKGGKRRTVPTHPAVWASVKDLPPGPIARTPDGARADRRQVMNRGNHHLQHTLGHHGLTMHQLRHWYGTQIYRARGEFVAQKLLGHASPATTAVYAQVASQAMVEAVAALPLPRRHRVTPGDGVGDIAA